MLFFSIMGTVGITEISEVVCSTAEVRGFCPLEYWGFLMCILLFLTQFCLSGVFVIIF